VDDAERGGLGAGLRAARRGAGLTQKQLAEALGVASLTVSRWERGVSTPSVPRLRQIAELTSSDVTTLIRSVDATARVAAELAVIREDVAETRKLVARVAESLERLERARTRTRSLPVRE
jgi:transcriptional regulator with XRE-family HTH domain